MKPANNCPHCHRPMPYVRLGIILTARQAQAFDIIVAAKDSRITIAALAERMGINEKCAKQHVYYVNIKLEETDYCLKSNRRGWRLERIRDSLDSDAGFVQSESSLTKARANTGGRLVRPSFSR